MMSELISEKEFFVDKGIVWGQWKLSLPEEQIVDKLSSLPKGHEDTVEYSGQWQRLFSILHKDVKVSEDDLKVDTSLSPVELDSSMEFSPILCSNFPKELEQSFKIDEKPIDETTVCLVDTCNQAALKLKFGLKSVREEMDNVTADLVEFNENSITLIIENAWSQLNSDASKLCFCVPFTSNSNLCERLCRHVLLPWMSNSLPTKLEEFSTILSVEGETVCRHLVAPLLQIEDSPVVQDVMSLEELMSSMSEKHWTTLLTVFISSLEELQKWNIPVLVTIVEKATLSYDDMNLLVQVMSSVGTVFAQSRDFGALLVCAANCLKPGYGSVYSQLKLIANNYRGPLKFKILKILSDFKE